MLRTILFFLFIFICNTLWSQEENYELSLKIPYYAAGKKEYFHCTALLINESYKQGFVRLRWKDKKTNQTIITDAEIIKESVSDLVHPTERLTYHYKKVEVTRNIKGKATIPIIAFDLWFEYDTIAGNFNPKIGNIPSDYSYKLNSTFLDMPPVYLFEPSQDSTKTDSVSTTSIIQSFKKINFKVIGRKTIEPFFALWELGSSRGFTVPTLFAARKKNYPTIYCITVIDVKDSSIAQNCKTDARAINDFFLKLSLVLDVPYKKIEVSDKKFSVQGVNNAINNIKAKPNDIIIFAYSGHGFSYRNDDKHQFSQMALWHGDATSKAMLRASTINLETIYNRLKAKGNRFNLVLGDCCNDYVAMNRVDVETPPIAMSGIIPRWNRYAATKLFIDTKNSFLLGATRKGEKAGSHTNYGGFFTYSFCSNIRSAMLDFNNNNPSWVNLIETTGTEAAQLSARFYCDGQPCQQTMIYKKAR